MKSMGLKATTLHGKAILDRGKHGLMSIPPPPSTTTTTTTTPTTNHPPTQENKTSCYYLHMVHILTAVPQRVFLQLEWREDELDPVILRCGDPPQAPLAGRVLLGPVRRRELPRSFIKVSVTRPFCRVKCPETQNRFHHIVLRRNILSQFETYYLY